jgi:hypothetical protein
VSFDGGNILLGGAGNDTMEGGGGNDILDGDAWLHVGLTSYSAGGQIIRQIFTDPNGNTYQGMQPFQLTTDATTGLINNFVAGTGHINAQNVDTAVYNGPLSNYNIGLAGPDGEGFITIAQIGPSPAIIGGNPQGLLGGNDDTDRLRHMERLQFTDQTIAIDSLGNEITSSLIHITGAVNVANYETVYGKYYDAVPFGTPTMTETDPLGNTVDPTLAVVLGNTMHGSIALLTDLDNLMDANGNVIAGATDAVTAAEAHYQWQYNDLLTGAWLDYAGKTTNSLVIDQFLLNSSVGVRLKVSYVDGKGYTENVFSPPSFNVLTVPGSTITAPFLTAGTQFNGIANTTAQFGGTLDFFSPFTSIFNDLNPAVTPDLLVYSATLADGQPLSAAGLQFQMVPGILPPAELGGVSLAGEFSTLPGFTFNTVGQILVRVLATDPITHLSTVSVFTINVLPPNAPPIAVNDSYATPENVGLTAVISTGVLHNDVDPGLNPMTAAVVTGPAHGTLTFNPNGTFVYIPTAGFFGTDSFTYQDTDSAQLVSNIATATITVQHANVAVTEQLAVDTGISATDLITSNPTISGLGNANAVVSGTIDGTTSFTTTANAAGFWSFTPTLADGIHTIAVSETNALNATLPNTTATLTFTLDTTKPVVTEKLVSDTGSSAIDNITSNQALSGTGDPNATVLVSIDGGVAISVTANAAGIWTITPVLADGVHTVVATETDLAGNVGTTSLTFTLDTKAPPVTVALVSDTGISATDGFTSNPALTGKGDPNAAVLISIDGGTAVSVPTNVTTGVWNFTPVVANGLHTVVVTETDLAGNIGTGSLVFTLDTISATPVLGPFTFAAAKNTLTSYTFSGTAEAGSSVVLKNGTVTLGTVTTAANGTWSFTTTPANKAANVGTTVTATATDLAGNVSTSTAVVGLIIAVVDNAKLTATGNTPTLMLALGNGETLTGGGGNDTFYATVGGGKNTLTGGGGTDTYDLSRTTGTVVGNIVNLANGSATIAGGGTDTLKAIQNVIGGSGGSNDLTGNGAGSVLTGGAGGSVAGNIINKLRDGVPVGGNASATMIGNSTNDQFFVNSVNDKVTENFVGTVLAPATDTVMTTLNSYTLGANLEVLKFIGTGAFTGTGNNLKDSITGGTGVNTLTAGTGGSVLIGGIANDVLTGGTGNDTMTGGAGNDTFKFLAANFGVDMIQDFTAHAGATIHDLIDLSGFVKAAAFTTSVKITQFNTTDALVTVNGGGATGGTIRLVGVLSSAINVTDFHLG